jgi:hypothetical protein
MRRLIVCCDGTWNEQERPRRERWRSRKLVPTNVVKLTRAINPITSDGQSQIVYYNVGVGTVNWIDRILGGAIGLGIAQNILASYRFLSTNYSSGDEIYLFGFSRGAYTVRLLCSLIATAGLLKPRDLENLPDVYSLFRTSPERRSKDFDQLTEYSRRPIPIRFLGVWDTVGSLGNPIPRLHWLTRRFGNNYWDDRLSATVEIARQALAIDERRSPFQPQIWQSREGKQDVRQVWFSGAHSDVGGGYADTPSQSDVAFRWMAECAREAGLELDQTYFDRVVSMEDQAEIHDSYKILYRLLPSSIAKNVRPIGVASQDAEDLEAIHESAVRRATRSNRYAKHSVNLTDAMARKVRIHYSRQSARVTPAKRITGAIFSVLNSDVTDPTPIDAEVIDMSDYGFRLLVSKPVYKDTIVEVHMPPDVLRTRARVKWVGRNEIGVLCERAT